VGSLGQREERLARAGAEERGGSGSVHVGEKRREARAEETGPPWGGEREKGAGPRVAHAGREREGPGWKGREGKGPEEEREREVESWAGPREWAALFYSLSFPFSLL
jgi:hypothetical protein